MVLQMLEYAPRVRKEFMRYYNTLLSKSQDVLDLRYFSMKEAYILSTKKLLEQLRFSQVPEGAIPYVACLPALGRLSVIDRISESFKNIGYSSCGIKRMDGIFQAY